MSIYRVTITKTAFVKARSEDEAKELALDDDCIMIDEIITDVAKSNKREMQKTMFGGSEE